MGSEELCAECGIFKETLKREIIDEVVPILLKRSRDGGDHAHTQPISLVIGDREKVLPNYASNAGILDRKIRELQQQIDRNFAEISYAKQVYQQEIDYLLKSTSYLDFTSKELKKEMAEYEDEVDYLLKSSKYLHNTTDALSDEIEKTQD